MRSLLRRTREERVQVKFCARGEHKKSSGGDKCSCSRYLLDYANDWKLHVTSNNSCSHLSFVQQTCVQMLFYGRAYQELFLFDLNLRAALRKVFKMLK